MKINLVAANEKKGAADLLIAGFFEKEKLAKSVEAADPTFAKLLKAASEKGRFDGKFGSAFSAYQPESKHASEIAVFGLGLRKNHKKLCFRKAVCQVLQLAKSRYAKKVRILLDNFTSPEVKVADAVELLTETVRLASYKFDRYRTK